MTFDPDNFIDFSQKLLDNNLCQGDEEIVKLSTIVNRSYYAVFLRIRDILMHEYNEIPKKQGEHRRTRKGLINKIQRPDLVQTYKTLWKQRVEADYKIKEVSNKSNPKRFAESAKDSAEYLLRELNHHDPKY